HGSETAMKSLVASLWREQRGALSSLTPRQTLAVMLLARASRHQQAGRGHAAGQDALRANLLFPEYPLSQVTLIGTWGQRMKTDPYHAAVPDSFRHACDQVNARVAAEETGPIEKLIFQPDGSATRILLDRRTGRVLQTDPPPNSTFHPDQETLR